ncbi:hemerythrin domain-containing protein [Mycobacterium sherrisii]|uniref:Hemerythrin n=1 Tax=Mycobacterium sherrisii TaxID=243061 RepID=A0A1E3SXF8_9MYCO|nr:hemerythrin domain-containing protein [Mycobacterium sherrisii]MCV7029610.1 hemerythrin domain-containing protein [Mycobacterium sherrisii]MEC4763914.1 hemerythrin domain-containing protein [Mycobacterium sherrisii]ODR06827.1 hemerythrin [Mycobacterium sherrisii]ORW83576.1 hemerythrin [Mycobacterium sherrisii]
MAHAAVTSPTDVVDFLSSQHEQIKSLFTTTLSASGDAREKAFVDLRRLLAVHETVEEEIVHPRAKRKIADGAAVVEQRLEEEHEAKAVLQKLEKLDVDSAEFTRMLTELRDAVLDHAEHEEKDEFTRLGQELSSDELESMGRAAKLAEAIAPTRPHAGVESQLANLVAGPFAAMLDRARDAIVGKG